MTETAQRIRSLRKKLKLSQAKLARLLDLTTTAVAAWEQGLNEPSEGNYLRLARLCDGELSHFFAIKGGVLPAEVDYFTKLGATGLKYMAKAMDMVKRQPTVTFLGDPRWRETLEDPRLNHVVVVPVVSERAAAGDSTQIDVKDIEEFFACPVRYAPGGPGHYTAVRVRGDSMEPVLHEKDVVCIDHFETAIPILRGKVVAALVDGRVVVKYLDQRSTARGIILISKNKNYGPVEFRPSASSRLIGRVVWRWGLFE